MDRGWHTVPLGGDLKRLSEGKKTIPKFEQGWRQRYSKEKNELVTPLAGAITGLPSGIVVLDCDNEKTYSMFDSMNPSNTFKFKSKDKPTGGGTIVYKYTGAFPTFKSADGEILLDYFADNGFIYLPTEKNETKEPFDITIEHELQEMPSAIRTILSALSVRATARTLNKSTHQVSNRLAPMLKIFLESKEYSTSLFKVLTPKSFRDAKYIRHGHLHPNDIPLGTGSEYLSKISAILGADISVSSEMYYEVMLAINDLWDKPMDASRLKSTIINPMLEGNVIINNEVVWQYDEHWAEVGFIFTSMTGDFLESFFDDVKGMYYLVNYSMKYTKEFNERRSCVNTIKSLTGLTIKEQDYDQRKKILRTELSPNLDYGFIEGTTRFNLFEPSLELTILNNPLPYAPLHKEPEVTLRFLKSFIPDTFMRNFILGFIKTKFTTFEYSPLVLYFIGAQGSGKDTFVSLLSHIIGEDYLARPDTKEFTEQYNGFLVDKFLVQLDEYGNKLQRYTDKHEVLGKIKSYSGNQKVQIRAMRKEGFMYYHNATFILTANTNPLPLEMQDRRIVYVETPNRLDREDWVNEYGGISGVVERLKEEVQDFCYYLATKVQALDGNEYVTAPETQAKMDLIISSQPASTVIATYIKERKWKELRELADEYNIKGFDDYWKNGRMLIVRLQELYLAMTDYKGLEKSLTSELKREGIERKRTTLDGNTAYYIEDRVLIDMVRFAIEDGDNLFL